MTLPMAYPSRKYSIVPLLLVSLLLHGGLLLLLVHFLSNDRKTPEKTYTVELRDLPQPLPEKAPPPPPKRRVPRETKPVPPVAKQTPAPPPMREKPVVRPPEGPLMPRPTGPRPVPSPQEEVVKKKDETPGVSGKGERREEAGSRRGGTPQQGEVIVRRKEKAPELGKLFPNAHNMAGIEDGYRRKYGPKLGGNTLFLDDDNDLMGSFARRFLEAVRGKWQIAGRQLLMNRDAGYGLLLISINRSGIVEEVQVVESSGNRKVDDEIIRTVKTAGYVGPLPKNWPYDRVQGYYIYAAGYEVTY